MKRKITAVLLCVALLLTLSVSVSADTSTANTQPLADTQITPITDEITVNVGKNDVEIIEPEALDNGTVMPLAQTSGIVSGGVYRIKNVASGKYMNVDYGVDANAQTFTSGQVTAVPSKNLGLYILRLPIHICFMQCAVQTAQTA